MLKRILFLFFLLPLVMRAQSGDVYTVVNAALEHAKVKPGFLLRDSALLYVYYDAESDSILINDLKDELSASDRAAMLAQVKSRTAISWDTTKFNTKARLIPATQLNKIFKGRKLDKNWKKYFKSYSAEYYEVSVPVFSPDHKKAIVYVAQRCGSSCGSGGATLFALNDQGKWVVVRNLFAWTN